jgi:hypothetical protein
VLGALIDESMDAWERSQQPVQRVRWTTGELASGWPLAKGNRDEFVEGHLQSQVGDIRYLTEARAALADLRKLYGLNVPSQVLD